jgi:hypothetical protein
MKNAPPEQGIHVKKVSGGVAAPGDFLSGVNYFTLGTYLLGISG